MTLAELREAWESAVTELEEIQGRADETTGALSEEDAAAFGEASTRADEAAEAYERAKSIEERKSAIPAPVAPAKVETVTEARTYRVGGEHEFIKDAYRAQFAGDLDARDRLNRHNREALDFEARDIGTGAVTGLVVPQYLTDLVAPKARAGRPTADAVRSLPLPPEGMTVNISRITTGTAAAAQATENSAVQETNADDTLLSVDVRTYAGQQDVSRQAIERGTGVDAIVVADLVADYHTKLDAAIISADGTSGTHLGILSTSGISDTDYTDASPTVVEMWPKLQNAIQKVNANQYSNADLIIMHPRRWGWLQAALDGSNRPLFVANTNAPQNAPGSGQNGYGTAVGNISGIPVITDANVPTTLGGGTEDAIIILDSQEAILWEQPGSPLQLRFEDVGSASLTVKFVVFGYSAFTAGRYPLAVSTLTDTGLVAPTF